MTCHEFMSIPTAGMWPGFDLKGLEDGVGSPHEFFPLYCGHDIDLERAPLALSLRSRAASGGRGLVSKMELLADLTAAQRRGGDPHRRSAAGPGRRGFGQDAGDHPPGRSPASLGIRADQVLALTFTNKAAGEMRERIEALVPRSRVWVGTFHGFCARMLRKYSPLVGIDTGFSIYDQNDRLRAVKDVMELLGWDESGWTARTGRVGDQPRQERPGQPQSVAAAGR